VLNAGHEPHKVTKERNSDRKHYIAHHMPAARDTGLRRARRCGATCAASSWPVRASPTSRRSCR